MVCTYHSNQALLVMLVEGCIHSSFAFVASLLSLLQLQLAAAITVRNYGNNGCTLSLPSTKNKLANCDKRSAVQRYCSSFSSSEKNNSKVERIYKTWIFIFWFFLICKSIVTLLHGDIEKVFYMPSIHHKTFRAQWSCLYSNLWYTQVISKNLGVGLTCGLRNFVHH